MSDSSLKGREIALGVTAGIAAYKAATIASGLVQRGAGVTVVMTEHAVRFIGPLTFQALTGRRVLVDLLDPESVADPVHVTLGEKADLVLVAPATANCIGKMAGGIADDGLTSLLLAAAAPVVIAPAMNFRMWNHPAVQDNLVLLKKRGIGVIDPEEGWLAEGKCGMGRLADPERIIAEVEKRLAR